MTRLASALAVLAIAGALAACGGDEESESGGQRAAEPTATATADSNRSAGAPVVDMTDGLKFEPQQITVSVGDRVEWRNVGNIAHTVTTDPSKVADPDGVSVPDGVEPWDSGLLGAGETVTRTFKRPGTYEYVCIPHEGARMVGTVIVEGR
jgi:plastocyanin